MTGAKTSALRTGILLVPSVVAAEGHEFWARRKLDMLAALVGRAGAQYDARGSS
jgi:hypothetical protein